MYANGTPFYVTDGSPLITSQKNSRIYFLILLNSLSQNSQIFMKKNVGGGKISGALYHICISIIHFQNEGNLKDKYRAKMWF